MKNHLEKDQEKIKDLEKQIKFQKIRIDVNR